MNPQTVTKTTDKGMQFVPFGAVDPIKLSAELIQKFVAVPTKSGKTCSERDAVRFMMLCQAQRLNPFAGDAYLVGYDGKDGPAFSLITAAQSFLKRAESHADFEGMESGIIIQDDEDKVTEREGDFSTEDENVVGGWARVFRKGRKPMYRRLSIRQRKPNYPTPFWEGAKANEQIVKCFDSKTEILTTRGFEKFSCAEGYVLQVTDEGLEPTTSIPFSQPYVGEMIEFENQNLDFCVTPNHDMAVVGGKMEAEEMYQASTRDRRFSVPRLVSNNRQDFSISDEAIMLAAIFVADGTLHQSNRNIFRVSVARPWKIRILEQFKHQHKYSRKRSGDEAQCESGRIITSRQNQVEFYFRFDDVFLLVTHQKEIVSQTMLHLSGRQARLFVDTLAKFDGHTTETGTRRFYSSKSHVCAAFELAAVCAGYCVSPRTPRQSDIGGLNYSLTLSEGQTIATSKVRDGRNNPVLRKVHNDEGKIWCVKVPTGKIVVRRNGFSFVCHNCAEADALRSTFPTLLAGLHIEGETVAVEAVVIPDDPKARQIAAGAGALPEQQRENSPAKAETPTETPQSQLEALIIANKLTFDDYRAWAKETGNLEDADSIGSFAEVPTEIARRMLKNQKGLLDGVRKMKGA
jgi:hypothetical protein